MVYDLELSRKIWTAPAKKVYAEMQAIAGQNSNDFDTLSELEKDFYRAHAQRIFGGNDPLDLSQS